MSIGQCPISTGVGVIVDNPSELLAWAITLTDPTLLAWRAANSGDRYLQVSATHTREPIRGLVTAVLLCDQHPEFWRELTENHDLDIDQLSRADSLNDEARDERAEAGRDEAAAIGLGVDGAAERAEHQKAETQYAAATQDRVDALWDSSDRRSDTAASLQGVASAEAVAGRMLADTGQGQPARSAVARQSVASGMTQPAVKVAPKPQTQPQRRR